MNKTIDLWCICLTEGHGTWYLSPKRRCWVEWRPDVEFTSMDDAEALQATLSERTRIVHSIGVTSSWEL